MIKLYKFVSLAVVATVIFVGVIHRDALAESVLSPGSPGNLGISDQVADLPVAKVPPEVLILRGIEKELKEKFKKNIFRSSSIPSLIYTSEQYALLTEARIGFSARLPNGKFVEDGKENLPEPTDPNYRPPPSVRKLQLGGIVFNTPDEWTIYLNGKRVTPALLPSEAVDLRVYKDFIELRWFDVQTNKIFPVRLRPNQTFNLDARVFLPG